MFSIKINQQNLTKLYLNKPYLTYPSLKSSKQNNSPKKYNERKFVHTKICPVTIKSATKSHKQGLICHCIPHSHRHTTISLLQDLARSCYIPYLSKIECFYNIIRTTLTQISNLPVAPPQTPLSPKQRPVRRRTTSAKCARARDRSISCHIITLGFSAKSSSAFLQSPLGKGSEEQRRAQVIT